jgi:hypothetical protein
MKKKKKKKKKAKISYILTSADYLRLIN